MEKGYTISLTKRQLNLLVMALDWYADDQRECAKEERIAGASDAEVANYEREADAADGVRGTLEKLLGARQGV